jgi:hypothetical protein
LRSLSAADAETIQQQRQAQMRRKAMRHPQHDHVHEDPLLALA